MKFCLEYSHILKIKPMTSEDELGFVLGLCLNVDGLAHDGFTNKINL